MSSPLNHLIDMETERLSQAEGAVEVPSLQPL